MATVIPVDEFISHEWYPGFKPGYRRRPRSRAFFPAGNAGPALPQISKAKHVCAGCQARRPYLFVLSHESDAVCRDSAAARAPDNRSSIQAFPGKG